jgi:tetratricopeptide (TPR) repeat protein
MNRLAGEERAGFMPLGEALAHAERCRNQGRFAEAEAVCRQILLAQPNLPEAEHLLGVIVHQSGKLGEAIEHVRRAVRLAPQVALFPEIKAECINNPAQRVNVERELAVLQSAADALDRSALAGPAAALKDINAQLWSVEDDIRECEARADFGAQFVELARAVYRLNDERARLKRVINEISGSRYVEEKSYSGVARRE